MGRKLNVDFLFVQKKGKSLVLQNDLKVGLKMWYVLGL